MISSIFGIMETYNRAAPAMFVPSRGQSPERLVPMPPHDTCPPISLTSNDVARFWRKVNRTPDCWEWNAGRSTNGYGRFRIPGKHLIASRVAWIITHGSIPNGLWVLHRCDNRACVRPSHLFLGTAKDNARDMVLKGRNRIARHQNRGENNPRAKLTTDDVRVVREMIQAGVARRDISVHMGVSRSTIAQIASGRRWRRNE